MAIQPYDYPTSQADDFERKGHPGKFLKSITCAAGTTIFTSSNYGVGAIITTNPTTGTASLSGGGDVPLSIIPTGTIAELSVRSVKIDSGGPVYALIRNQVIR